MKSYNALKRELYYTASHEWIEFHDIEAFVGITNYRLTGVKQIKRIEFVRLYGFKKKGEVLANIQFDSRRIQVHMPVNGNIISINDVDLLVSQDLLLNYPETEGWLVKILVGQSCQRGNLLSHEQYSSSL